MDSIVPFLELENGVTNILSNVHYNIYWEILWTRNAELFLLSPLMQNTTKLSHTYFKNLVALAAGFFKCV